MKQFPYVEDYLEVINGDRDPVTGKLFGLFNTTPPIISLARYDVSIIDSMSQAAQSGKALTDKQAELAVKIILKYRKQLAVRYVDVTPIENPKYRIPLRQIDRTQSIEVDGNELVMRFPYNTKLIEQMRDFSKESQGHWKFDGDTKTWRIAITETNVIAAVGFGRLNEFIISTEVFDLEKIILAAESEPFSIELVKEELTFKILNATKSLLDYVTENNLNTITELVDNAGCLGYCVSKEIEQEIINDYSARIFNLMLNQSSKLSASPKANDWEDIIQYATLTNRWPLYVYEPDLSDRVLNNFVKKYFKEDETVIFKNQRGSELDTTNKKVVYFNKYNWRWDQRIPLLISSAGIMHGAEKTMLLQRAEKIVYFATDVYTANKGTVPSAG